MSSRSIAVSSGTKIVKDSFGEIEIASHCLYGAVTARSLKNFKIGDISDRMPIKLIHSLALIKQAAACVNIETGLDKDISDAISLSCVKIRSGKFDDQFPLVVWQTGSGTQTNMNVNEVVATLANQYLETCNIKKNIHPNDHVNKSQSSNDTFPTAMNISIVLEIQNSLLPTLTSFLNTLTMKVKEFWNIIKIGRTHMQDATPLRLGQEFSSFQSQIKSSIKRISLNIEELKHLAIGGTAVGTGLNTFSGYDVKICEEISKLTAVNFVPSDNKFEALSCNDSIVQMSGCLNTLSVSLMKIANDIRLLGSGPRCGIGEISLPENEPGSSIMPGYDNAAKIAKHAHKNGLTLKESALELKLMESSQFDKIVKPEKMLGEY
ncbi:hypothetical protein A3Q56_05501 [Intoshia linei]|uniref:fumarate hydratase n=1 Tax=Intoshia linei TaxID=1819745 RepID=A0A177AZC8_9BILA|nr:hypothetical protein A3Q56_05501 [Intoshia linei]